MALVNWRRNDWFPSFNTMVDNFFGDTDDFFKGWPRASETIPAVNVVDSKEGYKLEVAAPGMKKEDFKVEVKNSMLTISAEGKQEKEEKKDDYTRKEFSYTSFSRSFWLPENVNADAIKATYNDGLLCLNVPKVKAVAEPEVKKIAIS